MLGLNNQEKSLLKDMKLLFSAEDNARRCFNVCSPWEFQPDHAEDSFLSVALNPSPLTDGYTTTESKTDTMRVTTNNPTENPQ